MKNNYSIEIDKYSPAALIDSLKRLEENIPDFEYDWRIFINAGGIDYGIYLNINIEKQEIEICNQPEYEVLDDCIDDVLKHFEDDDD